MKNHKFRLGQAVTFVGSGIFSHAAGNYEVSRLMPDTRGVFQYRIKDLIKGNERVVLENELKG